MDVDKLYDLYKNNLASIMNPYMLATISDRTYDIHGFNLVNRLLIYIQNKYTTSLKSDSGWDVVGRAVKSKSSPIWVIENTIKTEYIDAETEEVVEDTGLNPIDIDQAVKLGILKKVKTVTGLRTIPLFNIKDTKLVDKNRYNFYYAAENNSIKLSSLLNLASSDFNIRCAKSSGRSYYDDEENTIYIGNDTYEDKVVVIISGIADQIDCTSTVDSDKLNLVDKSSIDIIESICNTFIIESLTSYCDKDHSVESKSYDIINELDLSDTKILELLTQTLYSVYDLIEEIICMINPDNHRFSESTLRKAAELLSILEANEAMTRLRGQ